MVESWGDRAPWGGIESRGSVRGTNSVLARLATRRGHD